MKIRICLRTPAAHEGEVNVRGTDPRPRTQVVRKARGVRLDENLILRGVLDVHRRDRIERARDDRICPIHIPQLVRFTPKKLCERIENRVGLNFSTSEAARETHDGVEISRTEVVDVHEARGVARDEETVRVRGVSVRRVREGTRAVDDLGAECGWDVCGPGGDVSSEFGVELGVGGALGGLVVTAAEEVADDGLDLSVIIAPEECR